MLTMNFNPIETLSHFALHYLVSPKHGRKAIKNCILKLNLNVKDSFHKGIYGVFKTPFQWPTQYYEKSVAKKPRICPICGFKAKKISTN